MAGRQPSSAAARAPEISAPAKSACAGAGVDDVDGAEDVSHRVGDPADGDALLPHEVVDAPAGLRLEAADDAVGQVLDVDEAPRLQALAGDRQRLAGQRSPHEDRDHARRPRARPVGDAEAQDGAVQPVERRVRAAVHLPRELGRRVEVVGQLDGVVLVDRARGVAVDPDRARVDDARDARAARGLQHVERAPRVDRLGLGRTQRDIVDVGRGGQVDDGVAAAHRLAQGLAIEQVAQHGVDLAGLVVRGRAHVEDARLDPGREQAVDDVRAYESGSTGDEDPHACAPFVG